MMISLFAWCLRAIRIIVGRGTDGKRRGKQRDTESKRRYTGAPYSFTHVSDGERAAILELREQGLGTHEIAGSVGRSSRTVNKILRENGMNRRNGRPKGGRGQSIDREQRGPQQQKFSAMKEEIEKLVRERIPEVLDNDPELTKQIIAKMYHIELPKQTLDDYIEQEIAKSPEYRRRLAQHHLEQMERGGRSEMDIVREGLVMFFSVLDQAHRGDWPGVVRELVTSGEMRRTLVEALRIWNGGREPNADVLEEEPQRATHADDRRTEGTNSIAAGVQGNEVGPSVSQQPDQCAEAKVVRIGAPRRKRKHLVATPEILEALRRPLPDLSAKAQELLADWEPFGSQVDDGRQNAVQTAGLPTEGTNSRAAAGQGNKVGPSVSQQPDQCAEAKVVRIGAPRRKRKHLVATPEILEALRRPLPDLTESATRLLGDKDSDEPPVDYRQEDEFNSRS